MQRGHAERAIHVHGSEGKPCIIDPPLHPPTFPLKYSKKEKGGKEDENECVSTHRSSVRSCHDLPRWRTETERREAGLST